MSTCRKLKGCSIEFDCIGLHVNFEGPNLETVRYLFDKFLQDYDIDHEDLTIAYCEMSRIWLQKFGLHSRLDYISWISGLGRDRLNFFKSMESKEEDESNLFNYVTHHKSIAVFIGDMDEEMKSEWNRYLSSSVRVPMIHLYAVGYEIQKHIWVGEEVE